MDGRRGTEDLAAYYAGLSEEQAESGSSVTAFAEQVGISAGTLYSWRRRLRGGEQQQHARLLEVDVVADERRAVSADIRALSVDFSSSIGGETGRQARGCRDRG